MTGLHIACKEGQYGNRLLFSSLLIEIVELLLKIGMDINSLDFFGRTPIYWAAIYNYPDIVTLLIKNNADYMTPSRVCFCFFAFLLF